MPDKKFGDLKVGDAFEVYGDEHLNYNFPKICTCIKVGEETGMEIDGINFSMDIRGSVFVVKGEK